MLKYDNRLLNDKVTYDIKMYSDNNDFIKDDVMDICIDTYMEKNCLIILDMVKILNCNDSSNIISNML